MNKQICRKCGEVISNNLTYFFSFMNILMQKAAHFALGLSFLTVILFSVPGCASAPPTEDISEVILSSHTGLLGVSFTITFRGDGAARCECSFYRLDKNNKPR